MFKIRLESTQLLRRAAQVSAPQVAGINAGHATCAASLDLA